MRPGALLLSPRNTAVWWIDNRLGIWGVPPGRGERAPHASRHNKTPDGTLNTGAGTVMSSPGGLAIVLDSGPVVTARRGLMPAVGSVTLCGRTGLVHALTKAATPAPPATWSSRRRLTNSRRCPSDPGAFMKSRYKAWSVIASLSNGCCIRGMGGVQPFAVGRTARGGHRVTYRSLGPASHSVYGVYRIPVRGC